MRYSGLGSFLSHGKAALARGPVALIFAEDAVELDSTLRHHLNLGFRSVVVFMPAVFDLAYDLADIVQRVDYTSFAEEAVETAVNAVIAAAPGVWFYYCYNAEYLFYAFCESRSVGELLTFHTEERRDSMMCFVVDLYAPDLKRHPDAVALDEACLDRSGYYALARPDPADKTTPRPRQMDFFGGLRWRFDEHVPQEKRKIDRIALFRARPNLKLRHDHTFDDEEYNTYACPWHNNLTAAIVSFRTAKALKKNPGSTFDIHNFQWHNSVAFEWNSRQLLDLGLMEPGQWF